MSRSPAADFLVEIGTEELPPKALRKLCHAFRDSFVALLKENHLEHVGAFAYGSPRRLALLVPALQLRQADREVEAKGPPVKIAFDEDGNAKPAAIAFAKKCGVEVDALGRVATDKGEWLSYSSVEEGIDAAQILAELVERSLAGLPIPRRMRWGASEAEFVRPVHWVLMLHGTEIVPGSVMGHETGRSTRGHRFMSTGKLDIASPEDYLSVLEEKGFVVADFEVRERRVREQVLAAGLRAGGRIAAEDALYEEVAALTEWPVAMIGRFDEAFLELPPETIIASLTGHQRYFPVAGDDGLLASFVFVANLESRDPEQVREGNERVIHPRLADAAFFWEGDRRTRLEERISALSRVVYQKGLGSLADKSSRVESICKQISAELDIDGTHAARAAVLAKCDLLTGMVGEFPELQGVMGAYYAQADGEKDAVAPAIRDQYRPRFAGDDLPATVDGQVLALADKLDTLAGVFSLGNKPSGNKDPFGLRRAALGVVRILIEAGLDLTLRDLVDAAIALQPVSTDKFDASSELYGFIRDRLRSYYTERADVSAEIFDAVSNAADSDRMPLTDFDERIAAVVAFADMSEAESLAAANKRISNILQQAEVETGRVDTSLLAEDAEIALHSALVEALLQVRPLQEERKYAPVLARLAELRGPVDRFFDEVMVMADDDALRRNRLALLSSLQEPFRSVADISRLSTGKS